MALPKQFAWLLGAVATSFLVLAFMPNPLYLGVALVIGGATIAPALTVENNLVGRIAPAAMLNEAYTWVVTVSVGGQRGRRRGGRRDRRPARRAAVGVRASRRPCWWWRRWSRRCRPGRWPGPTSGPRTGCAGRWPPPDGRGDQQRPLVRRGLPRAGPADAVLGPGLGGPAPVAALLSGRRDAVAVDLAGRGAAGHRHVAGVLGQGQLRRTWTCRRTASRCSSTPSGSTGPPRHPPTARPGGDTTDFGAWETGRVFRPGLLSERRRHVPARDRGRRDRQPSPGRWSDCPICSRPATRSRPGHARCGRWRPAIPGCRWSATRAATTWRRRIAPGSRSTGPLRVWIKPDVREQAAIA